jgi:tetratricopeptide (TPR) repeat protein
MAGVGSNDAHSNGWLDRASSLLDEVDRAPETTAAAAAELARSAADPAVASIAWRAAGIGLRMTGRLGEALGAFDAAIEAAERCGDQQLAGLARTSRAAPRFITGDMAGGLDDLRFALAHLDGGDRGVAVFQHAQYLDVIEDPAATDEFDRAVSLLRDSAPHAKYLGHALANRGLHHTVYGRFDDARSDLAAAGAIWDALGLDALAATVEHNLGLVTLLDGDFVAALGHFESAQRRTSVLGQDQGASGRDYCDALLAVGLAGEAYERAADLARVSAEAGDELAASELRLIAAHAALQIGDGEATVRMATLALDGFEQLRRPGWAAQARLALARAAVTTGAADIDELDRLATDLHARGWRDAALNAELLAADAEIAEHRFDRADQRLRRHAGALRSARSERRLQAHTVEAGLAGRRGDPIAARRAVRRGLAVVEQEQRAVGAIDARAHFASHAARLLDIGRTVAVSHRDPRTAWTELERMRALSLRRPRVRPVDDAELGALLGRLRQVSVGLAAEEPGDAGWQTLGREQRRLQRQIADHVRRTPGLGDTAGDVELSAIAPALDGGAMVTYDSVGGRLWAFVFDGRMRRVDCGPVTTFTDRVAAAQMAVRRLARRTTNAHSVALAIAQLLDLAAWFDANLSIPAGDDRPLALVIPAELAHVPWGALPSLTGRPFTLSPSAWSWLGATDRPRRAVASAAFVAGPGLPIAATEVAAASAHYDGADVLVADRATATGASRAIERAELVHVAAHYTPRRGNPLFSGFELADGPWFLHDLTRAAAMPATWVVPSCESSVGEAPVAGELLGLTSVLLGAGVRSVVMSSGLVPDDEITATTMAALHARLATGVGPAAALAAALTDAGDTPAAVVLRATLACHGAW